MLTRGTGNTGGIFKDVAAMVNAGSKNGRRLELYDGTRYQVSSTDDGGGVLLSTGNFANKVNTPDVDGLLSRVNMDNVNLTNLDAPLFQGFQPNKLTTVSAPSGTNSDVTHTRASTATYIDRYGVLKTAGIDELREAADGYQIESVSTNLLLWSEDFSNVVWTNNNVNITANSVTSPSGVVNADRIESTGDAFIRQSTGSLATGESYIFSIYLRTDTPFITQLVASDGVGPDTIKAITVTQSWTRFEVKHSTQATALFLFVGVGNTFPIGESLDAWGAQLEEGNLSSYIPTTNAPATRAPDFVTIQPYNNIPNLSNEWALCFGIENVNTPLSFSHLFDAISSIGNFSGFFLPNKTLTVTAGFAQIVLPDALDAKSIVINYDGVNTEGYLDGVLVASVSTPNGSPLLSGSFHIGQRLDGIAQLDGNISVFKSYSNSLTADEIKLLSGV